MTDLKPCPFCGTNLLKNGPFSTRNADCYVHAQHLKGADYGRCPAAGIRLYSNDAERIALWNKRSDGGEAVHTGQLRDEPLSSPPPSGEVREAVARVIEPEAWGVYDQCVRDLDHPYLDQKVVTKAKIESSLLRAADILALIPTRDEAVLPEPVGTPKSIVMPNGDTLTREYETWDRGITLKDQQGKYATNEEGWELVESYGLDALVRAMLAAASAPPPSGLPEDVVRLVKAARHVANAHDGSFGIRELSDSAEPFASRLPAGGEGR